MKTEHDTIGRSPHHCLPFRYYFPYCLSKLSLFQEVATQDLSDNIVMGSKANSVSSSKMTPTESKLLQLRISTSRHGSFLIFVNTVTILAGILSAVQPLWWLYFKENESHYMIIFFLSLFLECLLESDRKTPQSIISTQISKNIFTQGLL